MEIGKKSRLHSRAPGENARGPVCVCRGIGPRNRDPSLMVLHRASRLPTKGRQAQRPRIEALQLQNHHGQTLSRLTVNIRDD